LNKWWDAKKNKQARTMPQWASRLTLLVKDTEVERLENGLFMWVITYELVERLQ